MTQTPYIDPNPEDLDFGFSDSGSDMDDLDLDALNLLLGEEIPEPESVPGEKEQEKSAEKPDAPKQKEQPAKKPRLEKKKISLPPIWEKLGLSRKKFLLIAALALLATALAITGALLLRTALDPYGCRILPGVTMGGIDVSNMTLREARQALKAATKDTFPHQAMVVQLPDGTVTLAPEDTRIKFRPRAAAKAAYALGREGTDAEIQAAVADAAAGTLALDLRPFLTMDTDHIRAQLEAYAAQHNIAHTELSYRLEGNQPELAEDGYDPAAQPQNLMLTLGTPLTELDVDAVLAQIQSAYGNNQFQVIVDTIPGKTQPAAPDLEAIAREFQVEPVSTTLDMQTYQQIPGSYGYGLDLEAGKKLLETAQPGETIAIPMAYLKPEILGDEVYFREELGYCETKHTNNEDRNTNLKLACASLNGVILQPGEEFSYNDTVGQRTAEKGYKPAAAYSGTRTVNSIGGGVCQVSTTLYNSALLADMEITERINHGFKSGYIGVGLDATVSWGGPDFKFRNNSHFPVMIQAEVSDGYVKIRLMGTDEKDYYIKMTSGYSEDATNIYAWSYKSKYDKETDELISREKEAYSHYMK